MESCFSVRYVSVLCWGMRIIREGALMRSPSPPQHEVMRVAKWQKPSVSVCTFYEIACNVATSLEMG
jgi:hypothetical protein